nr:putative oxidoreductase [Quercus suber]
MTAKPFNVAIVGYGVSAKVFHIPLILALPLEFKLYGIVQRSPKADDDAGRDHPGAKIWRSVEDMYTDAAVDVVIITSIPETHFAMCKAALEAAKHVVVEKPFVPTAEEANDLIAVRDRTGKHLTVYQNRRWDSDYLTLRKIMADGQLGDLAEFETHFDRHRPDPPADSWKTKDAPAHGALYDLGSHLIDQVYHAFGMPQKVTGFLGNQRRGVKEGAPDSCTVLLHYDAMLATVKAGVVSAEEEQLRFWIKGSKGSFQKFHLDVQEGQLRGGSRPGDAGFAIESDAHFGTLTSMEDGKLKRKTYPTVEPATYVEFYRLLAAALKDQGEVPVKAEEARDVMKILDAAAQSSAEERSIRVGKTTTSDRIFPSQSLTDDDQSHAWKQSFGAVSRFMEWDNQVSSDLRFILIRCSFHFPWLFALYAMLSNMFRHLFTLSLFLVSYLPFSLADLVSFEHSEKFNAGEYGPWVLQSYNSSPVTSPRLNMMKPFSKCEDGSFLFIAPRGDRADSMPYILDSNGSLVWTADHRYGQVYNFQSQIYRGQRYLTFWAGDDSVGGHGAGTYYMLDQHYQEYRRIEATAGLRGDLHEFAITKDNTALITVYDPAQRDLSGFRENMTDGYIWEAMFQELDLETGEALFTWRASEHMDLHESYEFPGEHLSEGAPWDWFHINSIDKDDKGNYIVSSRYLRNIICVSGSTGEVLWRLGGKNNSFQDLSSGEATTFVGQHDARWDQNFEAITFFDNRADWSHRMADQSRGVRILVDTTAMTAQLERTFEPRSNGILSTSQGSYRTLPNRHVILGYGVVGVISEYSPDGELLCDAYMEPSSNFKSNNVQSYRNFKLPWIGMPNTKPSLVLKNGTFFMSWLGSTEVKSWVLEHTDTIDPVPSAESQRVARFYRDGFETSYQLVETERVRRWVHAVALDAQGRNLAVSAAVDVSLESDFWSMHGLLAQEADSSLVYTEAADEPSSAAAGDVAENDRSLHWPNLRIGILVVVAAIVFTYCFVHFHWRDRLCAKVWSAAQKLDQTPPLGYQRVEHQEQQYNYFDRPGLSTFRSLFRKATKETDDAEQHALFETEWPIREDDVRGGIIKIS